MILEGVVTTHDAEGRLNVAPMGPIVDADMTRLVLRPFKTSTTYRNLKATGCGVFHITDDVLLIARAALGQLEQVPPTFPAERVNGAVLRDACRWYEFEVESLDDSQDRTEIVARVVHVGRLRDFIGLHRARHAVIEAAILATRIHLTGREPVLQQLSSLRSAVEKTGEEAERTAFAMIERFVRGEADSSSESTDNEVRVRTGSRLHFGPFAVGATSGRRFGGVGLMIDAPGVDLTVSAAASGVSTDEIGCDPIVRGAIEAALRGYRETLPEGTALPPVRLRVDSFIPPHAGLGSGTQTALAVARGLSEWEQRAGSSSRRSGYAVVAASELARRTGRGLRSGIGIAGFESGGLLLDAGKSSPEGIGTLVARLDMPAWPFVLVTPNDRPGLSGAEEREAFSQLGPMRPELTDRLCRIALLDLAGAVREADFRAATRALFEFGAEVGRYFTPVQGGTLSHPQMQTLAERLRRDGIEGVGQTSWGPTLFAMVSDATAAANLTSQLATLPEAAGCVVRTAIPRNTGATVAELLA
jgi:beta-RFAP synthase